MKISNLFQLLFIFIIPGCHTFWSVKKHNYTESNSLPGVREVGDNFYADLSEVANIHWLEYLHWLKKNYSDSSEMYINALPDTLVWQSYVATDNLTGSDYLRWVEFRNHPIVGVNQQQVMDYSNWRSDRVFQMLLVRFKVISADSKFDPPFSIENYFKGVYNIDTSYRFYPKYRLPTEEEMLKVKDFVFKEEKVKTTADSLKALAGTSPIWLEKDSNLKENVLLRYTRSTTYGPKNRNKFTDIYGNVREWIAAQGLTYGGGWQDSLKKVLHVPVTSDSIPTCYIGFRNVCQWEEWEE